MLSTERSPLCSMLSVLRARMCNGISHVCVQTDQSDVRSARHFAVAAFSQFIIIITSPNTNTWSASRGLKRALDSFLARVFSFCATADAGPRFGELVSARQRGFKKRPNPMFAISLISCAGQIYDIRKGLSTATAPLSTCASSRARRHTALT